MRYFALAIVAAELSLVAMTARAQETPTPAPATAAGQTSNYFNPSISVIGNFLAVGGSNRIEDLPSASLRESELGLQAVLDPYARADFFISFSEEGVDVEEGFITFTALPWTLLARVGKMKATFGKINTLHPHVLPWADSPLTQDNLLGGEEGWKGEGVSFAKLIPLGDTFSEATLQVFRGDAEGLFESSKRSELAYNGHYRVFADLSESTNLDAGLSYASGPNGTSSGARTTLDGVDLTLRWKPLQQGSYHSASLRGEFIRSSRKQPDGKQNANGWFLSGEYQLAKRWFVGARVEAADHADNAVAHDTGQAAVLTFWPSEYSLIRLELRRRVYGGPNAVSSGNYSANEALFQLQFAIGAHGVHPF